MHEGKLATAIRISAVSNPALNNAATAVTALLLVPLLEIALLVTITATAGPSSIRESAYASVLISFSLVVLMGVVEQVTRDRQLGVLQEILGFGLYNFPYWLGKVIPPMVLGIVPAILTCVAVYLLDPQHDSATFATAIALLPVATMSAALTGIAVAIFSVALADPYLIANAAHWVLLITAGVVVPLTVYPQWLAAAAMVLPFAHVLAALRSDSPYRCVAWELIVTLSWFALSLVYSRRVIASLRSGRRTEEIW